jgi:hypothetical protein
MVTLIWRAIPPRSPTNHATIIKFTKHITHYCYPTSPYTTIAMPRCSRKGPGNIAAAVASQSFLQILAEVAKSVDSFFWLLHPIQEESKKCLETLFGINLVELQSVLRLCGILKGTKLQFASLQPAVDAISIQNGKCLELTKWKCPESGIQQYYLRLGKLSNFSPRNVKEQKKQLEQRSLIVPEVTELSDELCGRLTIYLTWQKIICLLNNPPS